MTQVKEMTKVELKAATKAAAKAEAQKQAKAKAKAAAPKAEKKNGKKQGNFSLQLGANRTAKDSVFSLSGAINRAGEGGTDYLTLLRRAGLKKASITPKFIISNWELQGTRFARIDGKLFRTDTANGQKVQKQVKHFSPWAVYTIVRKIAELKA